MKLRKLLAVTAVAATMTAAFAVNAMADTTNEFFDFEYKDGVITLSTEEGSDVGQPSKAPYTMLVVKVDSTGFTDKEIADSDIKQIDQADAPFTTINVGDLTVAVEDCETCSAVEGKETCTCTHTYEIRLGGDGDVRWGTLTIEPESTGSEYYDDGTILLGDTTGDGNILGDDGLVALNYTVGAKDVSKNTLQALDTTDDGNILGDDALLILNYTVGDRSQLGTKTISQKTNFVTVLN